MKNVLYALAFLCITWSSTAQSDVHIPVQSVKSYIEKKAVFIDVRTPEEFEQGSIPTAVNLNVMDPSFEDQVKALDKNKTIVLFCQSGNRSKKALQIFQKMGFKNVKEVEGGYVAWRKAE